MPNSALKTISARPASSSSEVARRWVVSFAEIFGKTLTPQLVDLWCGLLADLPPDVLNRACEQTAKTARFFPAPGEIRAHIDQANATGSQLEAETAWQSALDYARQWYIPGIGRDRRAPKLPAATEHAINAAGGLRFLERCSEDDLVWAKKRFVEDFQRIGELGRSGLMLTGEASRRVLRELTSGSDAPKRLPAAPVEIDDGPGGLQAAADVLAEVVGRESAEAVTR